MIWGAEGGSVDSGGSDGPTSFEKRPQQTPLVFTASPRPLASSRQQRNQDVANGGRNAL